MKTGEGIGVTPVSAVVPYPASQERLFGENRVFLRRMIPI